MFSIEKSIGLLSELESLEALMVRLPKNHSHRKLIEFEMYRRSAGERGEKRMIKKFNEFFFEEPFQVLWDVNLGINEWKVQLDGLLLTRRCAIILESKNISGEINFIEHTDEFHRINLEGEKKVMEDPTIQLSKNIRFLTRWFKLKRIELPVDGLVVFTPKQCEFHSKPRGKHICKTYQMVDFLHRILQLYPQNQNLPSIKRVSKILLSNQTPYKRIPLCQLYRINPTDLKTGILCKDCKLLTMYRTGQSWICKSCGKRDNWAHKFVLQEYFSLIDNTVTNQQFRWLCQLSSSSVAKRLLNFFELESSGNTKARIYRLKE